MRHTQEKFQDCCNRLSNCISLMAQGQDESLKADPFNFASLKPFEKSMSLICLQDIMNQIQEQITIELRKNNLDTFFSLENCISFSKPDIEHLTILEDLKAYLKGMEFEPEQLYTLRLLFPYQNDTSLMDVITAMIFKDKNLKCLVFPVEVIFSDKSKITDLSHYKQDIDFVLKSHYSLVYHPEMYEVNRELKDFFPQPPILLKRQPHKFPLVEMIVVDSQAGLGSEINKDSKPRFL
ncbi:hypothetical protein ACPF04_05800 [Campylobacter sp. MOP51]|uniref:hypothetical protein n=1 Tax=Campylobacter canis TaxID=3378588 RepID=UPI003C3C532E